MRSKLFLSSKQKRALRAIIDNREFAIKNVNDLAAHLGLTYSQVSNSISGGSPCSEEVYKIIAEFLGEQEVKP